MADPLNRINHHGSQPISSVRGLEKELKDKQEADPKLNALANATPRVDAAKGQIPVFHGEGHVEFKKIGLGPSDLLDRQTAEKLIGDHTSSTRIGGTSSSDRIAAQDAAATATTQAGIATTAAATATTQAGSASISATSAATSASSIGAQAATLNEHIADNTRHAETISLSSLPAPLTLPGTLTTSITAAIVTPPRPLQAGVVQSVSLNFTAAGTGYLIFHNPDLTISRVVSVTSAGAGWATFTAGVSGFPADIINPDGGVVGYFCKSTGGGGAPISEWFQSVTNAYIGLTYYLRFNTSTIPIAGDAPAYVRTVASLQLAMVVNIKTVNAPRQIRPKTAVQVDTNFPTAIIPASLTQLGGWTFPGVKAVSGAASLGAGRLQTLRDACSDEHIGAVTFKAGDGTSAIVITRGGHGKASNGGVALKVDFAANTWSVHQFYEAATVLPTAADTVSTPFTNALSPSRFYKASIRRDGAVLTLSLTDLAANQTSTKTYDASVDLGASSDPLQDKAGFGMGSLGACAITGSIEVYTMYSADLVTDVRGVVLGDSIFRGNRATYVTTISQKIKDNFREKVLVSALDGSNTRDMVLRFNNIVNQHQPEWAFIMSGTNPDQTSDDAANLAAFTARHNEFLAMCAMQNITPIIGYFPPVSTFSGTAYANLIAALDALPGVRWRVRFDIALSLNNDGATPNPAMLADDLRHWNDTGHAAALARALIDCPLFYGLAS